jgi:hypothetical protein
MGRFLPCLLENPFLFVSGVLAEKKKSRSSERLFFL